MTSTIRYYTCAWLQDWWRTDLAATWRGSRPGSDPCYAPSSLSVVPGCGPLDACPDQAHTWHLGVGREFTGSMIVPQTAILFTFIHMLHACVIYVQNQIYWFKVLLACRLHWWGGNNIDVRLHNAHLCFDAWRRSRRLSTSVTKFELKTFKCSSILGCMHLVTSTNPNMHGAKLKPCMCAFSKLRLADWPKFGGKGYDVSALCRWLHHVVNTECTPAEVP